MSEKPNGNGLAPWANFTASAFTAALLGWMVTQGAPAALEKFDRMLQQQRADFREELKAERTIRTQLASEGHRAASRLADEVSGLRADLREIASRAP